MTRSRPGPAGSRGSAVPAAVLGGVLALTACAGGGSSTGADDPGATPSATGTTGAGGVPSPSATTSASPAPPAPRVGSCHRLTFAQATSPTVPAAGPASVACRGGHTAVTVRVGRLPALQDGHLLAVDSAAVRARVERACPPAPPALVGGDLTARRLSRLQTVWLTPTVPQADAGADWFRCDVVAVAAPDRLAPLPRTVRGVLDTAAGRDRFGTCGTAAPSARGFRRVVCAARHSWRAVDVVPLPRGTRYLDRAAGDRADQACQDVASARADGALRFSWSFEWPQRAAWDAGQRYGYCWVPEG